MLELLKLYPNKTSMFVGLAIGLATYMLSTSLCVLTGCTDGNPYYPIAQLLGAIAVGSYCSLLTKGPLMIAIGFAVTFLTFSAIVLGGIRGVFDSLLGGETVFSHTLLYGVITLVLAYPISLLRKRS